MIPEAPEATQTPAAKGLRRHPTRVLSIARPSEDLVLLRLRFSPSKELRFRSGQFVYVWAPTLQGETKRPYSIASPPSDANHVDLAVKSVNPAGVSGWLYGRQPKDVVEVSDAYGTFFFKTPPERTVVFLATGTGVAPFRSMLLDLLYAGDQRKIWLFLGSSHPKDLPYHAELQRLSENFQNFRYIPTLSRASFQEWGGARGWIQEPFLHHFYKRTDYDAYICGVRRMVDDAAELVAEQGLPKEEIHLERYV